MDYFQTLSALCRQIGFDCCTELNMQSLQPREAVRQMCRADRCSHYDASWSCPPACGTLEALAEKMQCYDHGILVQSVGHLADDFDGDTILRTETLQKQRFETLVRQTRHLIPDVFPMACGTCTRCRKCTYPDRPCRYPERVFPSMEACGLMVKDVCDASGMPYWHGARTVSFISCLLYCDKPAHNKKDV